MTDSDDIIVLTPDEVEDAPIADGARSRLIWPFALAGGVILGFAIAVATYWFIRPDGVDVGPLDARISALETELADFKSQPVIEIPDVDLDPLTRRIDALEARPTVDPLNEEIVSRLEALRADGFELPDMPEPPDLAPLEARIEALESEQAQLETKIESQAATAQPAVETIVDPDTLPRFPADVLRNGAQQLSGSGFMRRTFARHVRVKGSDDPDTLIAGIETDLAQGRIDAALEKFDRLPTRLQSLARAWRADMEDMLP